MPAGGLLLIVTLAGLWLAGRALASRVTADRRLALFLAPGLGMACWLMSVHLTARWTGSFWKGLEAGTAAAAISILGWLVQGWFRWKRSGHVEEVKQTIQPVPWPMFLAATLSLVVIAPMTLGWSFHDEQLYTGHTGIISQIQNGHYPPRHMTFPDLEYRYHYGFDLEAAAVGTALGVSPGVAIDILTLSCWWYTWCLLWLLGDRLLGNGRGWITALTTLFGGGLPFLLALGDGDYVPRFVMICEVGGMYMNPPMISYFFQHPWAIGLPLALCALLICLDDRKPGPVRHVCLGLLLSALTISQMVLYVSLAGSLLVAEVFASGRLELRRAPGMVAALVFSLLAGKAGGGFFLPPPDRMGMGLSLHSGATGSWGSTLIWHGLTFGLLLPLGLIGLFLLPRGRLLLSLLLGGSLLVLNSLVYVHSWDILKFGTVSALALSIAAGAAILRVFAVRPLVVGVSLGLLLLVPVTGDGLAFPLLFAIDANGIPPAVYPREANSPVSRSDMAAIDWLRHRVPPGDLVYRRPVAALAYDHIGGLAVPWMDVLTGTFGFSRQRIEGRIETLLAPWPDPDRYNAEGIRWFVLGPEDGKLSQFADGWIKHGQARVEAQFGPLRVIRLLSASDRSSHGPQSPAKPGFDASSHVEF